jgi:hypothetical protein
MIGMQNLEPLQRDILAPVGSYSRKAIEEEFERLAGSYTDVELEMLYHFLLQRRRSESISTSNEV